MKKQLLLLVMILLPMVASADPVEIDGIYYNLLSKLKTAEVTSNPNKYTGTVVIPESVTYEGTDYSVVGIGKSTFASCKGLISVTIPNSVTSIGIDAFSGCSGLTSLTIPTSVTSIGNYAFYACSKLTSITIPNSVTTVGSFVFYGCTGLTSITIPNGVTNIGDYAFQGCSGLTSVTIPSSVTSIETDAFRDCTGLTSVHISDLEAWCKISFSGLANPLYYAHHLFLNGEEIKDMIIPNGVTSIGNMAFLKCTSLTSVTIPNSVTSIGSSAFEECSALTSVTIPNSVTSIEMGVFYGCKGLTSVDIPNSVTSIGISAFGMCSNLTSVTIGSGVNNISDRAFASCKELSDVYCHAINVPYTHADAFKDSYTDYATLHVPAESVNAYKAADPWKNFKSIVSLEGGDTPEPQKCEKPIISYMNGQLKMSCATEGVEYVTDITDVDVKKHYNSAISLTATYNISVYATKSGYENSETASAILCWIDQKPTTEGITDGIANVPARALLIKNNSGQLTVEGAADGEAISVYTVNGVQSGSAISQNGAASIDTNLQTGSIAIVKIGDKSVKVVIK